MIGAINHRGADEYIVYIALDLCLCVSVSTQKTSKMATNIPPVLKCIGREQREADGYKTFKDRLEKYQHEYIGPSVFKYVQNYGGKESLWINPYQAHFRRDIANKMYNSELMKWRSVDQTLQ